MCCNLVVVVNRLLLLSCLLRLAAEQSSCDRFVEKRLLMSRIDDLSAQIKERDDIERKIEVCVRMCVRVCVPACSVVSPGHPAWFVLGCFASSSTCGFRIVVGSLHVSVSACLRRFAFKPCFIVWRSWSETVSHSNVGFVGRTSTFKRVMLTALVTVVRQCTTTLLRLQLVPTHSSHRRDTMLLWRHRLVPWTLLVLTGAQHTRRRTMRRRWPTARCVLCMQCRRLQL